MPRLGLLEVPPARVLGLMMPRAGRGEVGLAGGARRPFERVVELAPQCRRVASGAGASGGAGADQVGERAGRCVLVFAPAAGPRAGGDGFEGWFEVADQCGGDLAGAGAGRRRSSGGGTR
jgi:hypothetical protein